MKNKILNIVVLVAIYCFAISAVPKLQVPVGNGNDLTFSQEKIVLGFSSKIYLPSEVCEIIPENNTVFNFPELKNHPSGLWTVIKNAEQLFFTRLSQNVIFSRNILVNARKLDLIFPFQYFW